MKAATEKVGVAQRYRELAQPAAVLGLVKAEDANLDEYVTLKALDGLYFMLGEEEEEDPQGPARNRQPDPCAGFSARFSAPCPSCFLHLPPRREGRPVSRPTASVPEHTLNGLQFVVGNFEYELVVHLHDQEGP